MNGLTRFTLFLALSGAGTLAFGELRVVERTFATAEDFNICQRDAGIELVAGEGVVRLTGEDYIIHAQGNKLAGTTPQRGSGRRRSFTADVMGKKVFPLEDERSRGAFVYVFGGQGDAMFNGVALHFEPCRWDPGWSVAEIAPDGLRRGDNELILREGFRLVQDRETDPPRFSFIRRVKGGAWEPAEGGEFLVNLKLVRHRQEGTMTSPVMDLANPTGGDVICPLAELLDVTVTPEADVPEGTSISIETRWGASPVPGRSWSDWHPVPQNHPFRRFMQWRAILKTSNPLETPRLSRVTVQARHEVIASAEDRGMELVEIDSDRILRSSYEYGFQAPSRKLRTLRKKYDLEKIVETGETDLEKLILLRNWVRRQWPKNDGFGGRWDALEILAAPEGGKGMCVHFANLFSQCALALGFCARPVIIDHHFIAEAWSREHEKWVAMDVEAIYPPVGFRRYATAHYEDADTRVPLSILEVHQAYHRAAEAEKDVIGGVVQVFSFDTDEARAVPHDMLRKTEELSTFARFGHPPRNNHLDQPEPWEEYHGQDHYHSNGYLWWKPPAGDGRNAPYPWKSDRPADFEWSVNQVQLALAVSGKNGTLTATAQTFTPNFERFLHRIDGGRWRKLAGAGTDPHDRWAELDWSLHGGKNTLEIKPVNRWGREGAIGRAVVRVAPEG